MPRYTQIGGVLLLIDEYGKLITSNISRMEDIARGIVPGCTPFVKIGCNDALSNVTEDLWPVGGEYVFPNAEMGMEVVSTSAEDSASGTGVKTARLIYLNSSFVEKTVNVTLNGTTPIAFSVSDIYRVQSFRALTCGSVGRAVGDIDLRHLSDSPIYSRVSAGQTRSRNITYTVPYGKKLFICDVLLSCGANVSGRHVRFSTKATYDAILQTVIDFFMTYTELILQDNSQDIPLVFPTAFPTGVTIKISAISPDGAVSAASVVRGWLEDV